MLCVLFIGARIRALQIDPKNGAPQAWAQWCFYLCAYSVLVQTVMVIVVPYLGGKCEKGDCEGDVTFTFEGGMKTFAMVIDGVRYLLVLALYGGFTAVVCSVFMIEAKDGKP